MNKHRLKDWKMLAMEFVVLMKEKEDRRKIAIQENISFVVVYVEEVMMKEED